MSALAESQYEFSESKFQELMLYIATRMASDPAFGATKLNKVLFYADMLHYADFGSPITGATYFKLRHGPAPKQLLQMRLRLLNSKRAALQRQTHLGFPQKRLVALDAPDLTQFSATELGVVDEICDYLDGLFAYEVSEGSHRLMGWQLAADKEEIPYHTIFLVDMPLTDEDVIWAEKVVATHESRDAGVDS